MHALSLHWQAVVWTMKREFNIILVVEKLFYQKCAVRMALLLIPSGQIKMPGR